jgi:hypothetical protein
MGTVDMLISSQALIRTRRRHRLRLLSRLLASLKVIRSDLASITQ